MLHPLVMIAALAAIIALVGLRRRVALAIFVLCVFLIPSGQQILVGGVHVFVYRLIVLAGWSRILLAPRRGGVTVLGGGWNSIDWAFLLCILCHSIAFSILYASGSALTNQVGYIWDYIGGYFLLRNLVRDEEDGYLVIKCLTVVAVVCAVCMLHEQFARQNIFGLLGGVRLTPEIREGRIRSQAVFQHAILAGTFGGTLLPLLISVWPKVKSKAVWLIPMAATLVMAVTTACSTPILTLGAGLAALCFWPFRGYLRELRWGTLIVLVGLQVSMKAPVWALIERVDLVQGSSSYHRYQLVNQFIRHSDEWLLLGTKSNASWGDEMIDTSNAYVEEGTGGGILALLFFILVIARAFGRVGRAAKRVRRISKHQEWLVWGLGACLFAHVVGFFGIYYFDQTRVSWFIVLAMISAITSTISSDKNLPGGNRLRDEESSELATGVLVESEWMK